MSPLPGTIHGITTGGLAGTHADPGAPAVLVAPATTDEKNTIRAGAPGMISNGA